MRLLKNPYKTEAGRNKAYIPKEVTVAMITYIPNFLGYYKDRFEVFKVSINSLIKNTTADHDLLILDNGSCPEVIAYLMELRTEGYIDYLFLSAENLGYNGGLNFIYSASPGHYIAYSDDDVFFHPGWLEACMQIQKTYPKVGYVTGCPAIHNLYKFSSATHDLPNRHPEISLLKSDWQNEWNTTYANSIGSPLEVYLENYANHEVPKYSLHGVNAYAVSTHFQYVISKEAIKEIYPFKVGDLMSSNLDDNAFRMEYILDKKLDELGYAKLTTDGAYTEHLGNVISERCVALIDKYKLAIDLTQTKVFSQKNIKVGVLGWFILKLMNTPIIGRIPYKLYDLCFRLIGWKQSIDKQNVRMSK
jgi:glycosyltransferase involved in cell wall biosynthesis